MKATAFRLVDAAQAFPLPRRIESEAQHIHEARVAAVKRLGDLWQCHPKYQSPPRHSVLEAVWSPARGQFLAEIARRASEDRRRNPTHRAWERVRTVLGDI